jgi:hypothetical protein
MLMEREMDMSQAAWDRFEARKDRNKHCYVDRKTNCIMIKTGREGYEYDIDLDRCKTAAQCLDWIHQVCLGKNWATSELVKDFVEILFRNIDVNLWSGA